MMKPNTATFFREMRGTERDGDRNRQRQTHRQTDRQREDLASLTLA